MALQGVPGGTGRGVEWRGSAWRGGGVEEARGLGCQGCQGCATLCVRRKRREFVCLHTEARLGVVLDANS